MALTFLIFLQKSFRVRAKLHQTQTAAKSTHFIFQSRRIAEERCIRNANFSSFGINAADGKPINEKTIYALQEIGIDITDKQRKRYSAIEHCDDMVYIAMDKAIYDALITQYYINRQRVHLLGDGIFDPKGCEQEVYCKCRDEITSALLEMFDMLAR